MPSGILEYALYVRWLDQIWRVFKAKTKAAWEQGEEPNDLVLSLSWFNPLDNNPNGVEEIWSNWEVFGKVISDLSLHAGLHMGYDEKPSPSHKDTLN